MSISMGGGIKMIPEIRETPECYQPERGKYSLDLKKGESITIWGDTQLIIEPRVSNSITIRVK